MRFYKYVIKMLIFVLIISSIMYTSSVSIFSSGNDSPATSQWLPHPGDNNSTSASGYLTHSNDEDWYHMNITKAQKIRVNLFVPSNKDYDIHVYDKNLELIGKGLKPTGYTEEVTFYVTPRMSGQVYFKVVGWAGAFSTTNSYTITANLEPDKPIKAIREAYRYVSNNSSWRGRWSNDRNPGVAYSWGNKDTVGHFWQKLNQNSSAGVNSSVWTNQFTFTGGTYNGNPSSPNISTVRKFGLGLYGTLSWSGGPSYNNPFLWAGVDCSGLVQRAQYTANYNINNIGNGQFNTLGNEVAADWWANTSRCYSISLSDVNVGDVVTFRNSSDSITHVMIVSHVPYTATPTRNNVYIIHAFADMYNRGRKCMETRLNAVGSNIQIWRMKN